MKDIIYKKKYNGILGGFVLIVAVFLFILSSFMYYGYHYLLWQGGNDIAIHKTDLLVRALKSTTGKTGFIKLAEGWQEQDRDLAGLRIYINNEPVIDKIFTETADFFEINREFETDGKKIMVNALFNAIAMENESRNFALKLLALVLFVVLFFATLMWLYLKKNILIPAHTNLKEQENKFLSIMENIGLGIAVIDRNFRMTSMNRTMREWFPDVVSGANHVCYSSVNKPAGEEHCENCPTQKTFESGFIHTSEIKALVPEGEKHFRMFSSPVKNRNGIVESVLEVAEDITEEVVNKERLEAALRENKLLMEIDKEVLHANDEYDLLRRLPEVITRFGGYKLCWIGYKDEESSHVYPVGQSGFEDGYLSSIKVTYDTEETGMGPVGSAIRNGEKYIVNDIENCERFEPWKEESRKRGYASVVAFPLMYGPKIIGAISVYSDKVNFWTDSEITLLSNIAEELIYGILFHRSEDALLEAHELLEKRVKQRTRELDMAIRELSLANEELEAVNKTKSEFLAVISHDIRTPMNGILGMSQLLMDSDLDEDQKHDLEIIKSNGEILLQLINDILDLSKIESGGIELEEIPFDLKEILASLMKAFEWNSSVKGIQLYSEIQEEIPSRLLGDPHRLKQVFLNLVGNAVKFTERGFVRVSAEITVNDTEYIEILFRVTDTGIGIPADRQEDIFKSYTQADKSISRKFGGTGLGTTIAKNLVGLMGGDIRIKSPVNTDLKQGGDGSEFYFAIRFKKTENVIDEEIPHERISTVPMENIKILVAEDNKVNQLLITKILKKLNVEFALVEDGVQAVDAGKTGDYNIIFMDVNMPEMGGLEASSKLRELGINIPIIAVTADSLHEEQDKMDANGITASIMKPFKIEEISDVLNKYLSA